MTSDRTVRYGIIMVLFYHNKSTCRLAFSRRIDRREAASAAAAQLRDPAAPLASSRLISMFAVVAANRGRSANACLYEATLSKDASGAEAYKARGLCAGTEEFNIGDFIGFYTATMKAHISPTAIGGTRDVNSEVLLFPVAPNKAGPDRKER